MPLIMIHDIRMKLSDQFEIMNDIERAFAHLDFEFTHMLTFKHKRISFYTIEMKLNKQ